MARILVVDDEESVRTLVRFTLEDAGHSVSEAADGEQALAIALENEVDLIVLDVMMPRLDGWGVLRELRRSRSKKRPRVVMLTAKASEEDIVSGWRLGVDDYITKPFEPDDLALAVNETLMLTEDQIVQKRVAELEKANLLSRIESAFGEDF